MVSSKSDGSGKLVVDSVHGDIHLTDREVQVIDTASFQRLRRLKQLAMGQMVYPNATHTRFAHSLGVFAIMKRITDIAEASRKIALSSEQKENLCLAALLHDIGHYPYSHLMERIDKVRLIEEQVEGAQQTNKTLYGSITPYPEHDLVGTFIVTEQPDLIDALGSKERAEVIANIFGPKKPTQNQESIQLSKLVNSSLDMDRLDYLLRDSKATGVPYGGIDINYLLNNLQVSPSGMVGISEKAIPAAEQFLLARFFMHRTVYYHKTTFGMEEVCRQLLFRLRRQGKYGIPKNEEEIKTIVTSKNLGTFTDAYVDRIIQEAVNDGDKVIQTLAKAIQGRHPPKLLKEVNVLISSENRHEPHKGTVFKMNCKHNICKLAKKIPLELFILCETPPLRLEKRGLLVAAEEAMGADWREEEELIKVFEGGADEPKSLVDIPYSLISKCAGHFFQSFRLYVVYEGSDKNSVITKLRERVKDWDKA
jgi:HD superfamily phosphohydrolase